MLRLEKKIAAVDLALPLIPSAITMTLIEGLPRVNKKSQAYLEVSDVIKEKLEPKPTITLPVTEVTELMIAPWWI